MDARTGMIADLGALQKAVDDYVVEPFDHTFLNKDIAYFENVVPTAENIAVRIGQLLLAPVRELGAELHKIKLIESPNNSCEIFGADLEEVVAQSQQPEAVLAAV
jgi:6-pyruvoyltetrahydropterin/6-carboxytetrahydropterin synthase